MPFSFEDLSSLTVICELPVLLFRGFSETPAGCFLRDITLDIFWKYGLLFDSNMLDEAATGTNFGRAGVYSVETYIEAKPLTARTLPYLIWPLLWACVGPLLPRIGVSIPIISYFFLLGMVRCDSLTMS